jgi:hypothetical protein
MSKSRVILTHLGLVVQRIFVTLIAKVLSMFPFRNCDEYCDKEAWKLICLYYMYLGYFDSCNG